jgi:2-keto-4-pentenoate hydratase
MRCTRLPIAVRRLHRCAAACLRATWRLPMPCRGLNTERALKAGRRLSGRKIGLTSRAVQRQLGVDQPDFGMLYADMAFGDGEEIPWSRLMQAKCEAEVALVLERHLTQEQLTVTDLIRATAYALPAIEVVGSRIAQWDIRITDTIADNASSGVYVLGHQQMPSTICASSAVTVFTFKGKEVTALTSP